MAKRLGFDRSNHWDIAFAAGLSLLAAYWLLAYFCLGAFRDSPLPDPFSLPFGLLCPLTALLLLGSCLLLLLRTAAIAWRIRRRMGKGEWGLRIGVLAAAICLTIALATGQVWRALAMGALWRVDREMPLTDVQQWVVDLNQKYGIEMPDLVQSAADSDSLVPEKIRPLLDPGPNYRYTCLSHTLAGPSDPAARTTLGPGLEGGNVIAIRFSSGGGFLDWGVVVAPPGHAASEREGVSVYRWGDGIYGYVD